MSSVTIEYGLLGTIACNSSNAASRMKDYINDLTNRVKCKYGSITGGHTSKTQSSEDYVGKKISQLRKKENQYERFAKSVRSFSEKAQDIDREVAKKIRVAKDNFIDKHEYIKVGWWTDIRNWFIDLKNACPLFEAISQKIKYYDNLKKTMLTELKYWYRCNGGKEIIEVGKAIAGVVIAVVLAVCALCPPIVGIVAICLAVASFVSGVIAVANAIKNVETSIKAKKAKKEGDPAMAKIYADQNTWQDAWRQKEYEKGVKIDYRSYYKSADALDFVQTVCDIAAIVGGANKAYSTHKEIKLSAQKGKVSYWKRFKDYLFNSKSYIKDSKGNTMGWRNVLQKRGEIHSWSIGASKAMSLKDYEENLTSLQRFIMKVEKGTKYGEKIIDYTGEAFDFTLGRNLSRGDVEKNVCKYGVKYLRKESILTDTLISIYNLKDNYNTISENKRLMGGLKGLVG